MSEAPALPEQIHIKGLNPAVVDWLRSESGLEAVSLAHRLVGLHHWNLSLSPQGLEQPALLLGDYQSGVVILANRRPEPEDVSRDQEEIKTVAPKEWLTITVVYLVDESPDPALEEALKTKTRQNLSTRTVHACALKTAEKKSWGNPPKAVNKALDDYRPSNFLALLQTVLAQQDELGAFLSKLRQVKPSVTYTLMTVCFFVYACAHFAGGTTNSWTLLRFGANFAPLTVAGHEWWRLLGSAFLHIGIVHILVNMYSLYAVGPTLEKFLGNLRYLGVYTASALAGSLASAFFGGGHISAGASGAIFGLLGSTVVLGVKYRDDIPRPIQQNMVRGMLPAIIYNLMFGFSQEGIDNSAHLGGLVAGALLTLVVRPRFIRPNLSALGKALGVSVGALLLVNQLLVMYLAWDGIKLNRMPGREVVLGDWGLTIPYIFEESQRGDYYEGPGINLSATVSDLSPTDSLAGKELAKRYSTYFGVPVQFSDNENFQGRTWYHFRADGQTSGYIAVTVEDRVEVVIGAFSAPDHRKDAEQVVKQLILTLRHRQ